MHQVVVFIIPYPYFPFQVGDVPKNILIVELFLVCAMRPLHRAVLSRFSRINEVVINIISGQEFIKSMKLSRREVVSFIRSGIAISENKGTFNSEVQHSRLLMVFSSQDVFWAGC